MLAEAAWSWISRHHPGRNFLSTAAAKELILLQCCAAFIAKHEFLRGAVRTTLNRIRSVAYGRSKKTPMLAKRVSVNLREKRKGHPATWVAFSFKGE
jgi:hypothetical protein